MTFCLFLLTILKIITLSYDKEDAFDGAYVPLALFGQSR